jgi:protein phosphatase
MSAKDMATLCECGHLGSDHRHPLPAPCRHGWDEKALRETIDNAHNCGLSTVFAADIEMDRQRAIGACPCIAFSPRTTMIHFTTATHIGRRTTQEDSFIAEPPFFAVADGMGGHGSGDVASRELLAGMAEALKLPGARFLDAFRAGHARLRATLEASANPSMGTTLTAIWLSGDRCAWLQAGDSRLYHRRAGQLRQVTTDQNLPPPSDNVLTRCVQARGGELDWEPEHMGRFNIEEGDELILCTDGVSKVLTDLSGSAEDLVRRAIEAGGKDNATAIVITLTA